MAVRERSRVLAASPEAVWRIVSDPHQLPRWWPQVRRVEGVSPERFTQVMFTARGRPVRFDMRVVPGDAGRSVSWEQELPGTPFERHVAEAVTSLQLTPDRDGTRVTIAQRQRLRGISRGGGWMLRRATARRLDEALARLAELVA